MIGTLRQASGTLGQELGAPTGFNALGFPSYEKQTFDPSAQTQIEKILNSYSLEQLESARDRIGNEVRPEI